MPYDGRTQGIGLAYPILGIWEILRSIVFGECLQFSTEKIKKFSNIVQIFHLEFCDCNEFHNSTLNFHCQNLRDGTLRRKIIGMLHTSSIVLVDQKGKGNLHISHQDKEKCRLFSALTFPHKTPHHWEELGWCRSGNVSAILYHSEHCRLTTLSRKTSLHSLREKKWGGEKKRRQDFTDCPTMCKPLCQVLWVGYPGTRDYTNFCRLPQYKATEELTSSLSLGYLCAIVGTYHFQGKFW